jgi:tetratricopeptide (TPR) repeat protein
VLAAGGVHVKSILAVVFLLALTSSLQAQTRRHSTSGTANDAINSPDFPDPLATTHSHFDVDPNRTPSPGNPISVTQLRVPSKAMKSYQRAQKAFLAGDFRTSVQHLEKSIEIYSDFLQAHYLLGVSYFNLGNYEKGLSEYQRALAIDPKLNENYHNVAVALFYLGRYPEAEKAARQALEIVPNPNQAATRYVLGYILAQERLFTPETLDLLRQSENNFPNARLVLARIFSAQGRRDETANELRAYLRAPEPQNKQQVECWLAQLSNQPSAPACSSPEKQSASH